MTVKMFQAGLPVMKKLGEYNGDGSSSVAEFSGIPDTYESLLITTVLRSTSNVGGFAQLTFETTPTAGTYNHQVRYSAATTTAAYDGLSGSFIEGPWTSENDSLANCFSTFDLKFLNYKNTNSFKTVTYSGMAVYNVTTGNIATVDGVGVWESTAAIDRIRFTMDDGNFAIGSKIVLYGIR